VRLRDVAEALDQLGHSSAERRTGVVNELANHFKGSKLGEPARREAESIARNLSAKIEETHLAAGHFFNLLAAFLRVHGAEARGYDQRTRITKALRNKPEWAQ